MKLKAQSKTVASSIRSTTAGRRTVSTLPARLLLTTLLAAAFLSGGYYESTYSLLAAGMWLGLAVAASFLGRPHASPAFWTLAALCGWTLLSALWGPAGPALRAAPLVALYAGILLAAELFDGARLLTGTWLACAAVVAAGLGARAADADFALGVGPDSDRLAWPLTYANGLGLTAVTCALLAAGLRLPPASAGASAALAGSALTVTFSRSAMLVGASAALLLVALRPAALRGVGAALAGIGAVAALASVGPTSGPLLLAAVAFGAGAGALLPDLRLRIPRRAAVVAAVPLVVLAAFLAKPVAARFAAPAPDERDARRLLDVSGHGRTTLWRTAWHEGRDHPLAGGGAGSWPRSYIGETGSLAGPANAHSLYLETFAELGAVGLAAITAFLALVAVAAARTRDLAWAPAAIAVFAAWALHAGIDWDWQLPATTIPALLAAGSLTGRPRPARAPVAAAAAMLAIGLLAGLHGLGAALLENGVDSPDRARLASRLLPYDARPYAALAAAERARGDLPAALAARERACDADAGDPVLLREDAPLKGCGTARRNR